MRFYYSFALPRFYGQCSTKLDIDNNVISESISIHLRAFTDGLHVNKGEKQLRSIYQLKENMNDEAYIRDIAYTLNHEYIHLVCENLQHHTVKQSEHMVYYMINNGGNEFFNEFHKVKVDTEWWPNE